MSAPLQNKPSTTRKYTFPYKYYDSVDASLTYTGVNISLLDNSQVYMSIGWGASVNGTLTFEATNDESIGYAPLPEGILPITGANNTNRSYNRQLFKFYRIRFTPNAGSAGLINISITVGHDN